MTRVLIIEDDQNLASHLEFDFQHNGFEVAIYNSGKTALEALPLLLPDCVILDLNLPGMNGLDVCRNIRQLSVTPIVIIATLENEIDKILAFELGADTYLTKPFSFNELKARVKALIRRTRMLKQEFRGLKDNVISYGELTVNLAKKIVMVDKETISLNSREYELLVYLLERYGEMIKREELLAYVWGSGTFDLRTVDTCVYSLRNKIKDDVNNPRYIHTAYSVGYSFRFNPNGGKSQKIFSAKT